MTNLLDIMKKAYQILNPIRPDNENLVEYLKCGAVCTLRVWRVLVSGWVPGIWVGTEQAAVSESTGGRV